MPDNSVQITAILNQLRTGATRVEVDGQTVDFDPDVLNQQLRDLMRTDTSTTYAGARKRPLTFGIYLGGF